MQRRQFVSTAGAGALGLLAAATVAANAAEPARAQRTFVLVHGAWHGGWCWSRVASRLRQAGHTVFAPSLTGLGDRSHLISAQINLDTHIADVVNVVESEELNEVVLVGHSYAGTIITGVADRIAPRLLRLVYLDAQLLESGTSLFDTLPKATVEQRLKSIRESGGGVGASGFPPRAFGITDPADIAWVGRRMTPQPAGTYSQTFVLKHPVGNGVPKTYIDCTVEPMAGLESTKARVRGAAGWTLRTLATGHDAMVIAPGPLSDLLIDIAA